MSKNKSTATITLFVNGMHCAACEIVIKKTLEKIDGVQEVHASTSNGKVNVTYLSHLTPNLSKLNKELKPHGYTLQNNKDDAEPAVIYFENGEIQINSEKVKPSLINIGIFAVLVYLFYYLTESGLAAAVMVSSEANAIVYLLFGIVAGASTCAALVGGVLLTLSRSWNEQFGKDETMMKRLTPHIQFHLGRLISYAIAGGVLALIGASITNTVTASAPYITIGVGIIMLILGLQMLNVSWAKRFKLALPGSLGNQVADSSEKKQSTFTPFYIGASSLLLPCGMTLTAFITAIASGSFISGAINMFAFAAGTIISLSLISIASVSFSSKPQLLTRFNTVSGMLVVFFAIFTLNTQLNAIGMYSLDDLKEIFVPSNYNSAEVLGSTKEQVIKMEASAFGYAPTAFTVKAGIPVIWEINNTGASGCTNAVIARDLFKGQVTLEPGLNTIEFTPEKPGTYKFSCWMGMVGGTIKVT